MGNYIPFINIILYDLIFKCGVILGGGINRETLMLPTAVFI